MTTPTMPRPDIYEEMDKDRLLGLIPPHVVVLYNDEVHSFDQVIQYLMMSVPLTQDKAEQITQEAHEMGRSIVISCPLETCELYAERLTNKGLTVTIEKAG